MKVRVVALLVTVDREGKTRVRERYVVSAPLAGRLQRIEFHPGDRVKAGKTVVAVLDPGDPALLDPRARAEAEARVHAAEEASKLAGTNLKQARTEADRARRLGVGRSVSQEELDRAEHRERTAAFAMRIAEYELELARAAFQRIQPRSPGDDGSTSGRSNGERKARDEDPSLEDLRHRFRKDFACLPQRHRSLRSPELYDVRISENLEQLRQQVVRQTKKREIGIGCRSKTIPASPHATILPG